MPLEESTVPQQMIPQEIIRRKRDGEALPAEDISAFIAALARGDMSEGQVAAFAMAVFFRGMSSDETIALTLAMRDSGQVLDWGDLGLSVSDKHSTGGVGDNVSLMLAPIAAACGLAVPMISGRGLGHTGGTLDKLQSIPGYDVMPEPALFRKVVREAGYAIVGQTADLAPADKRLYAVRDVTATVESVPLITASILSKKLAAGLQTLVLDVKVGNGAFMQDVAQAETLARSLVDVANGAGVRTVALLTDMNEPLANAAGNALEVANCLAFLRSDLDGSRLHAVVMAEAVEMLLAAGVAADAAAALVLAERALASGAALETFARMVRGLGGPADFCDRPDAYLSAAPVRRTVIVNRSGYLSACRTRDLGMAVVELGGGRRRAEDTIDNRVGFSGLLPLGTRVEPDMPLGIVHAASEAEAERAAASLAACYGISDAPPAPLPVVIGRIV